MKKDGKYRFSLQFSADSEEQVRAGELLERLGNRKSAVVVAALNDYLDSNPNLQDAHCKIEVKLTPGYNRDGIEEIIRRIVEERLAAVRRDEPRWLFQRRVRQILWRQTLHRCWTTWICFHRPTVHIIGSTMAF